jgi:hypothetical protein
MYKVYDDLKAHCGTDFLDCMDPEQFMANGKTSMFPIFTKGQDIFELLVKADLDTDEEVLTALDRLGEDFGALLSYVIGFNKKFETPKVLKQSPPKHGLLKNLF